MSLLFWCNPTESWINTQTFSFISTSYSRETSFALPIMSLPKLSVALTTSGLHLPLPLVFAIVKMKDIRRAGLYLLLISPKLWNIFAYWRIVVCCVCFFFMLFLIFELFTKLSPICTSRMLFLIYMWIVTLYQNSSTGHPQWLCAYLDNPLQVSFAVKSSSN